MPRLDAGDVVLKMVLDNPGITQPEIRKASGLLKGTINKKLGEFVKQGKLKRKAARLGRYDVFKYYGGEMKIKNYFDYIIENIGEGWMTKPQFIKKTGINASTLTKRAKRLEDGGYIVIADEKQGNNWVKKYKVIRPYDGGLELVKKKSTYKQHKTELEWEMAQYKAKEQLRNIFNQAMGMA